MSDDDVKIYGDTSQLQELLQPRHRHDKNHDTDVTPPDILMENGDVIQ